MSKLRRGDTVIEVIIAITVFCLVAILSITLMNSGLSTAQGSLELIMARNEIDAQAEALRFIQNSFLAEREYIADDQQYTKLWRRLTTGIDDCPLAQVHCDGLAITASQLRDFDLAFTTCDDVYDPANPSNIYSNNVNAFVLNTRLLQPSTGAPFDFDNFFGDDESSDYIRLMGDIIVTPHNLDNLFSAEVTFRRAPIYPRLVFSHRSGASGSDAQLVEDDENDDTRLYRTVAHAEGIWVIAVRSDTLSATTGEPEFFDFYIRSCWFRPGHGYPSTIGTIVRLYNPEVIE